LFGGASTRYDGGVSPRALASFACLLAACAGDVGGAEDESGWERLPDPQCFIGDRAAPAEIDFIARVQDGADVDVVDGLEVPLFLHVEGGQRLLFSVRARNISCALTIAVEVYDPCGDEAGRFSLEKRNINLEEDDGFARPRSFSSSTTNYANVPMCPKFFLEPLGDADGQPFVVVAKVTEALREGEDTTRVHELGPFSIRTTCAGDARCECECDADFEVETSEEQCASINDNDLAFGVCPE
jgi:hypothetical protein